MIKKYVGLYYIIFFISRMLGGPNVWAIIHVSLWEGNGVWLDVKTIDWTVITKYWIAKTNF